MTAVSQAFVPGPRLIDGTDLNNLVAQINKNAGAFLPEAKFTTSALAAGTLVAGAITGAGLTVLQNTGATPAAQTVRTAAQMIADIAAATGALAANIVGLSYILRIVNTGAGTLTLTADAGPTVTITGTATVAQNVFRDYIVTFTSATAATIQSVGSGVSP